MYYLLLPPSSNNNRISLRKKIQLLHTLTIISQTIYKFKAKKKPIPINLYSKCLWNDNNILVEFFSVKNAPMDGVALLLFSLCASAMFGWSQLVLRGNPARTIVDPFFWGVILNRFACLCVCLSS